MHQNKWKTFFIRRRRKTLQRNYDNLMEWIAGGIRVEIEHIFQISINFEMPCPDNINIWTFLPRPRHFPPLNPKTKSR